MEERKQIKKRIWMYVGGLILIPYPSLIFYGILAEQHPKLYWYADIILGIFIVVIVGFMLAIMKTVIRYHKLKNK